MLSFFCKHICVFCDALSYRKIDLCFACEHNLPILENHCTRCLEPLSEGQDICGSCLDSSSLAIKTTALFYYQSPIDQLITKLKFGNNLIGAKIMGELLAVRLVEQYKNIAKPEIIIPVPLHFTRLRKRGYNQALELSRPIAKELQIPIDKFRVKRIKNTKPQTSLNAKERKHNIRHAFFVPPDFHNQYVAVIDDVITTGNTVFELCKSLFSVGVKKIDIWCSAKRPFKKSINL
jgi:ComF family protein